MLVFLGPVLPSTASYSSAAGSRLPRTSAAIYSQLQPATVSARLPRTSAAIYSQPQPATVSARLPRTSAAIYSSAASAHPPASHSSSAPAFFFRNLRVIHGFIRAGHSRCFFLVGASYSAEFQVNPDVVSFISVFLNVCPFSACVSTELNHKICSV